MLSIPIPANKAVNQYMRTSNKSRSRNKNNNRRQSLGNVMNRVFDSAGPEGKVRGTPQQIIEKYQTLAHDSQLSGDRVAAENFAQHAEHYLRMLAEAQREVAERAAEANERAQANNNNNNDNQSKQGGDNDQRRQADDRGDNNNRNDNSNRNDRNDNNYRNDRDRNRAPIEADSPQPWLTPSRHAR